MSSQYPHLDLRGVAQRLFARAAARVHPLADCITLTLATTAICAAASSPLPSPPSPLATIGGRALLRDDDGEEQPLI